MVEVLKKEGKTQEQAQQEADQIIAELQPAMNFIADHANVYAVKPLFMLDAARLWTPDTADKRTWVAVGGGVQLTIVVAKFEAGYLRTVRRTVGEDKGNFVLRLVFQNLF
jgi:hypothetical protein